MSCKNNCLNGYLKVKNEETGQDEFIICECKKTAIDEQVKLIKLAQSGIPKYYWDKSVQVYKKQLVSVLPDPNIAKLLSFIDDPLSFYNTSKNLWIWGTKSGSYKTSLAIELGKSLLTELNKRDVIFIPFRKLMELFLDFDNKRVSLEKMLRGKVIIIDDMFDLSRSTVKEYQAISLYGFIEDLMNNGIRLICTAKAPIHKDNVDALFKETANLIVSARPVSVKLEV